MIDGIMECGKPSKAAWPERPTCVHGPMTNKGKRWICKEKDAKSARQTAGRERGSRRRARLREAGLCTICRKLPTWGDEWRCPACGTRKSLLDIQRIIDSFADMPSIVIDFSREDNQPTERRMLWNVI